MNVRLPCLLYVA